MKEDKLTITIPCYNQPNLLRRLLSSLEKQTRKDFTIVLIDDQSTVDYSGIKSEYPDLKISLTRNSENLGAIKNIFNSILYPVSTPYILSLHEDDALHPQYIDKALLVLDHDEEVAFVAATAVWFKDDADLANKIKSSQEMSSARFTDDKKHLIKEFVTGTHLAFGSIVYRKAALTETADIERFSVLCDRPFLASLLKTPYPSATIIPSAVYVRDHSIVEDRRGDAVREKHLINLYRYYAENLEPMDTEERKIFLTHTTNNLLYGYYRLNKKEMSFTKFIEEAQTAHLLKPQYVRSLGLFGIASQLFGDKVSNTLLKIFKKT